MTSVSRAATPAACAADRGVTTGTLDIIVYFMDTLIFQETDDLCGKTSCPIAPGVISIGYTQPLPPIAPPVSHTDWSGCCAPLHRPMLTMHYDSPVFVKPMDRLSCHM